MNASTQPSGRLRAVRWSPLAVACLLAACGAGEGTSPTPEAPPSLLVGQVSAVAPSAPAVSFYAASRFLDQAAFGPTPADVASVQSRGIAGWIDAQMALPASKMRAPAFVIDFDQNSQTQASRAFGWFNRTYQSYSVSGEDQLRLRTNLALSNFLVVSLRKIQPYGGAEYFNVLQDHAFGKYGDLLKAITRSPAMGFYLDNNTNTRWGLNENYARELMQLFSVGLVMLNLDGSVQRGSDGRPLETYTQQDVIDATRALTGWQFVQEQGLPGSNWANYGKPMVEGCCGAHDDGGKRVMGRFIGAGQSIHEDLDTLVRILVEHPNTAPFVSLRLIQGLTTSDPSPAYLRRVATVFRDSGGDLGRTVRAILLDPEARAGDMPGATPREWGRIREPYHAHVAMQRALGCQLALLSSWDPNNVVGPHTHMPMNAPSVFNFFPPNHRVPGSLLLAPEQRMLTSDEMSRRMGSYHWFFENEAAIVAQAGCDMETFTQAARAGEARLIDLLGQRMFRGAMPPAVRQGLLKAFDTSPWVRETPTRLLGAHIELINGTPAWGVIK